MTKPGESSTTKLAPGEFAASYEELLPHAGHYVIPRQETDAVSFHCRDDETLLLQVMASAPARRRRTVAFGPNDEDAIVNYPAAHSRAFGDGVEPHTLRVYYYVPWAPATRATIAIECRVCHWASVLVRTGIPDPATPNTRGQS